MQKDIEEKKKLMQEEMRQIALRLKKFASEVIEVKELPWGRLDKLNHEQLEDLWHSLQAISVSSELILREVQDHTWHHSKNAFRAVQGLAEILSKLKGQK